MNDFHNPPESPEGIYFVSCTQGERHELDETGLETALRSNQCPCGAAVDHIHPDIVHVACVADHERILGFDNVRKSLQQPCPACGQSVHLKFSLQQNVARVMRADRVDPVDYDLREDFSDLVFHFCRKDEFISILKSRTLRASPTGLYHKPAVCLTEVPFAYSEGLRAKHGNFGIAFIKRDILEYGGQPAIYITDALLDAPKRRGGFAPELEPFLNIIRPDFLALRHGRKAFDWLHEREWRVGQAIDLNELTPIALLVPTGTEAEIAKEDEEAAKLVFKYGRIDT